MSFGFMAQRGYYSSAEARAQVSRMAEIGIDSVAVMVSVMQETFFSTTLYQDFAFTASDGELEGIIGLIHKNGIRVMLKPMVECHDSSWRGNINFPLDNQQIQGRVTDYWGRWFESFHRSVIHYARLAERTDCEFYCIGCELFGAEQAVHNASWHPVIEGVREVYSGSVCYDAQPPTLLDATEPPEWMRGLDSVCISYYTPAAERPGAGVEEMIDHLRPTVARLRSVSENLGLPVIFGETGCRSMRGAAMNPPEFRTSGAYAPDEQSNFFEALCTLFWDEGWWDGFYWWKWDEHQVRPNYRSDPAGDTGFTIQGKPVEQVMKKWFLHGRNPMG